MAGKERIAALPLVVLIPSECKGGENAYPQTCDHCRGAVRLGRAGRLAEWRYAAASQLPGEPACDRRQKRQQRYGQKSRGSQSDRLDVVVGQARSMRWRAKATGRRRPGN